MTKSSANTPAFLQRRTAPRLFAHSAGAPPKILKSACQVENEHWPTSHRHLRETKRFAASRLEHSGVEHSGFEPASHGHSDRYSSYRMPSLWAFVGIEPLLRVPRRRDQFCQDTADRLLSLTSRIVHGKPAAPLHNERKPYLQQYRVPVAGATLSSPTLAHSAGRRRACPPEIVLLALLKTLLLLFPCNTKEMRRETRVKKA